MVTVGCNSENKNDGSTDSVDTNINNHDDEILNNRATDSASMTRDSAGMSFIDSATNTNGGASSGSGNQNR